MFSVVSKSSSLPTLRIPLAVFTLFGPLLLPFEALWSSYCPDEAFREYHPGSLPSAVRRRKPKNVLVPVIKIHA